MRASRYNHRQIAMKRFLPLLVLLTTCSCSITSRRAAQGPPGAPTMLNAEFRRAQHEAFSPRERDIILAAQRYLAHSDKRPAGASEDAVRPQRRTLTRRSI